MPDSMGREEKGNIITSVGIGATLAGAALELIHPGAFSEIGHSILDQDTAKASSSQNIPVAERQSSHAQEFYTGEINIKASSELAVRHEPRIPEKHGLAPNKLKWSDIKEINGVNIQNAEGFSVKNASLVKGEDADGNGSGNWWLMLPATTKDGKHITLYVSRSNSTSDFVQPSIMGKFERVYQQNGIALEPSGGFNKVTILSSQQ